MVLAKPYIIPQLFVQKKNEKLTQLKIVKKLKLCTLRLQVTTTILYYFNFYQ